MERQDDEAQDKDDGVSLKLRRLRSLRAEAERLSAEISEHFHDLDNAEERRRPGGHLHSVE